MVALTFFFFFFQGTEILSSKKNSNILVGNYCHYTIIYTYNLAYFTGQRDICAPSTLFGKG